MTLDATTVLDSNSDHSPEIRKQNQKFKRTFTFDPSVRRYLDCDFHHIDFRNLNMRGLRFFRCNFFRCNFAKSDLEDSLFWECSIFESSFYRSNLKDALISPRSVISYTSFDEAVINTPCTWHEIDTFTFKGVDFYMVRIREDFYDVSRVIHRG